MNLNFLDFEKEKAMAVRGRNVLVMMSLVALSFACAPKVETVVEEPPPKTETFVLLAEEDGSVGSIEVSTAAGSQEVREPLQAVYVTSAAEEPTPLAPDSAS